ncbi:MAG TPA: hypothetical protein VLA89_07920, partial [Gemmatimonadales bacterium]|nr:hypothetical protein [Gemmatimonadales bacterium]
MAGDQGKGRPDPNDPFADDGQDGEGANDEPQAGAVATEGGDESPKDDDPKALRETLRNQRRANRQLADRLKELERQAGQAGTAEERATAAEKDRDRFLQELQEERA